MWEQGRTETKARRRQSSSVWGRVSLELLNLFTNSIGEGNSCLFSGSQNQRRRPRLPEEPVSYVILIWFSSWLWSLSLPLCCSSVYLSVCLRLSLLTSLVVQERRGYVCSPLTPQCLKLCSTLSRYSISVYWIHLIAINKEILIFSFEVFWSSQISV